MFQTVFVFSAGALFGYYCPDQVVNGIQISQEILSKFLSM